jgi:ribosomal protein L37E
MAKIITIGEEDAYISRYCPQCRIQVEDDAITARGLQCRRCGFMSWNDFKNYPSFVAIPRTGKKNMKTMNVRGVKKRGDLTEFVNGIKNIR